MGISTFKMLKLEDRLKKVEHNSKLTLKDWLYDQYVTKEKSTHKIASELSAKPYRFEISDTAIATYLKHFDIPRRY